MNWKAMALASRPMSDAELMKVVAQGKTLNHKQACCLVGMVLRERGEQPEGMMPAPSKPKVKAKPVNNTPVQSDYVSSEDGKTPWVEVLEEAKKDDRLAAAITDGIIEPVLAK